MTAKAITGQLDNLAPQPQLPLGKYRHYKGGEYEVLLLAMHEATHEWCVVYKALYDTGHNPKIWLRTYADFTAVLEDGRQRFEKMD